MNKDSKHCIKLYLRTAIIANSSKIYDTHGKGTKSNGHGKHIFLFLEIFLILKFSRQDLLKN